MPSSKIDPQIVAQVLLGEGANQGLEGLDFLGDVMFNRSQQQGKSLEEIATAPKQFSAYARPDLADFFSRQPIYLQHYAEAVAEERRNPKYQPQYPGITNYVTQDLWNKRNRLPPDHWLHQMKIVKVVGSHVALAHK